MERGESFYETRKDGSVNPQKRNGYVVYSGYAGIRRYTDHMSKQEFGLVLVIIAPVLISMKTVPGAISSAILILIGFMLMTSKDRKVN